MAFSVCDRFTFVGVVLMMTVAAPAPVYAAWPAGCYISNTGDYICSNYAPPTPAASTPPPPAAASSCPSLKDQVEYTPSNLDDRCQANCKETSPQKQSPYTTLTPSTPVTCLGRSVEIISQSASVFTQSGMRSYDPLSEGLVDHRFTEKPEHAMVWRFRTPSDENATITIETMSFQWYHPFTSMGLSRIPCDTTSGIGGFGPIIEPTANGIPMQTRRFVVKKNATDGFAECKNATGSIVSKYPQLEPNTVYYLTYLQSEKFPFADPDQYTPQIYSVNFRTEPPPQIDPEDPRSATQSCTIEENPLPTPGTCTTTTATPPPQTQSALSWLGLPTCPAPASKEIPPTPCKSLPTDFYSANGAQTGWTKNPDGSVTYYHQTGQPYPITVPAPLVGKGQYTESYFDFVSAPVSHQISVFNTMTDQEKAVFLNTTGPGNDIGNACRTLYDPEQAVWINQIWAGNPGDYGLGGGCVPMP